MDQLIRELVDSDRTVTAEEIERIVERIATVPFSSRIFAVPVEDRGLTYQGHTLGARESALTYHLVKRITEGQWADGTTATMYVEDLRRAVRDSSARLVVYARRGGHIAATITPTAQVLPLERRGSRPLAQTLVVYSADRGIIVTGYQFSELAMTGIPRVARWLR